MLARYKEVSNEILKYKDSKDKLVRKTVINLISLLASYSPELFTKDKDGCDKCIAFLIRSLQKEQERGPAFIAIGEIAMVLFSYKPYLFDRR